MGILKAKNDPASLKDVTGRTWKGQGRNPTWRSFTRVARAWRSRPLLRHKEANLSHVSISSVGGSTKVRTARSDCHTWPPTTTSVNQFVKQDRRSTVPSWHCDIALPIVEDPQNPPQLSAWCHAYGHATSSALNQHEVQIAVGWGTP